MTDETLPAKQPPEGQFLLCQTEDGQTRIECRFAGETFWLTQRSIAELFQTSVPNVSQHLKAIYEERELRREATIKKYLIVQTEGNRDVSRQVDHYSLDAILAVGYRVRSRRGTQFRIWATERLREYLVKGFAMDDARLKRTGVGQYFEELLPRIRDIRSSERVFWKKVLDIYATSIDYDPTAEASTLFFKTIQNKMHWAAHGHTAAEIVHQRTDASKPNMGLTSWSGDEPGMRVLFIGEGPHDIGHQSFDPQPRPATGTVPTLSRRVCPAIEEDSLALAWREIPILDRKSAKLELRN